MKKKSGDIFVLAFVSIWNVCDQFELVKIIGPWHRDMVADEPVNLSRWERGAAASSSCLVLSFVGCFSRDCVLEWAVKSSGTGLCGLEYWSYQFLTVYPWPSYVFH